MVLVRLSDRTPFFVGLSLGIAIALIVLPILEDHCLTSGDRPRKQRAPGQRSPLSDDYEPIINLQGSPDFIKQKESKIPQNRPRYFSTELGIREKLLVAVFTSPSSYHSRAVFLNKTLFGETKTVRFFVILEHANEASVIPSSANVDIVPSPSDGRAFLPAFEAIAQKYIKDYDFVFMVTDYTYINIPKLLELLKHFSVSRTIHMGIPVVNSSSYSQCSLKYGLLLSHSIFRLTSQRLPQCHELVNSNIKELSVSNCISQLTQVHCSNIIQGHEYRTIQLANKFVQPDWKAIQNSTTITPIEDGKTFLQLHNFICHHRLQDVYSELATANLTEPWPLGLELPFKPKNRFHVLTWSYFNESHMLTTESEEPAFKIIGKPRHADVKDVIDNCNVWYQTQSHRPSNLTLANGYTRIDPTRGVEYILDFKTNTTDNHLRFIVFRPLVQSEMLPVPYVTEHTRVIILMPVTSKEVDDAIAFLTEYESMCLKKQENTALVLILVYGALEPGKESENDVFKELKAVSLTYANKYRSSGAKLVWYSIRTLKSGLTDFAMLDLVIRKLPSTSLILICQLGTILDGEYLNRIRMNTIAKNQVFFPIPFVQYNPSVSDENSNEDFDVKKQAGLFDKHDFRHSSFYILDYLATRSLVDKEVPIAHAERDLNQPIYYDNPVGLVDMFLKAKSLHVMRSVDPQLKVVYRHPVCLSEHSPKCLETFKRTLGSKSHLAKVLLLDKLKKDKRPSS